MTKSAALLAIANINLFPNDKPQVTFLMGKNDDGTFNKVQANFSAWDKEKGVDIKGINAVPKAGGASYIRLATTLGVGTERQFANGVLFVNKKKVVGSNQPDYTGTIDLTNDRNGPKLALAAWNKTGKDSGAAFISIAISEPKVGQTPDAAAAAALPPADNASSSLPMPDDIPFGN